MLLFIRLRSHYLQISSKEHVRWVEPGILTHPTDGFKFVITGVLFMRLTSLKTQEFKTVRCLIVIMLTVIW